MRNLFLIVISFVLFSCNDSKKEQASLLDSIIEDFSKMPDSVIQKGFAILDTIQLKPVSELVKELRQIPELQEIGVGDELLSFRLKNGPTMLIKLKEFSSLTRGGSVTKAIPPLMILNKRTMEENTSNVVGSQRGEDRQNKKALILAPYVWYFGSDDDPLVPLNKLPKNRNYKGGVTYKANKTKSQQQISFEDYLSFNDYDVVHFASHGSKTCKLTEGGIELSNNCRTYISTGITYQKKERQKLLDLIKSKNVRGIVLEYGEIFFTPKFFSDAYPEVNNKLFIFSSCQLGQQGDLEITFDNILQNGQLFYWQNTVHAIDAFKAFDNMYDRMLQYGETAPTAFENMPLKLKKNIPYFKKEKERGDSVDVYNYLKMASKGNAMHIIEPISFIDEKTKKELQEGTVYPFEGVFEDDRPEEASFTLEFLGYTAQEIEEKSMSFSLKVDGTTVLDHVAFLPNNDPYDAIDVTTGKNEKTTLVTFKRTKLKKDLKKNSSVKLEAFFHFSEENYGYQSINVSTGSSDMRIVMKSPDGTINMFFDADNYGLKMTHPAENQTLYSDEEGYIYMNIPGKGWMKTKLLQMFSAITKLVPIDMDFAGLKMNKGSVMHKIPGFAAEVTISMLEKEPKAKKISGGIGSEKSIFIYDGRLTITFDNQKRLESLVENGADIHYYYEQQRIIVPNAQIFSIPSFN
ncbi:hypothetical protein SAMN04488008_104406 [Maribacter orientalis]|uniref:CHAT domain-containing protein n=1 Tax=Maribacter orientalis TaxID=228957 RepID=A0A1H7RVG9_9FLAO|nr:hypothetical protein [Maribacter orientalis]SEL64155.1 hypothetical protein SAMN04488008_104406 [Maribacter orientalis]